MSGAVLAVQAALISTLKANAALTSLVTGIYDGPPARAAYPYVVVSDSIAIDWSTKSARGREMSLIVTLWDQGQNPLLMHQTLGIIEDTVPTMPSVLPGWQITTVRFVRSRILRTNAGPWSGLIEHRVRVVEML